MKIKCNNKPRDLVYWWHLTDKERLEFDWFDTEDKQDQATFVRYKGLVYCLDEFMRITPSIAPHPQRPEWEKFDGYASDSFYSGVLIKYVSSDAVIVATFTS